MQFPGRAQSDQEPFFLSPPKLQESEGGGPKNKGKRFLCVMPTQASPACRLTPLRLTQQFRSAFTVHTNCSNDAKCLVNSPFGNTRPPVFLELRYKWSKPDLSRTMLSFEQQLFSQGLYFEPVLLSEMSSRMAFPAPRNHISGELLLLLSPGVCDGRKTQH